METILEVLSSTGQDTKQDNNNVDHDECFLTLTDRGGQSDNRY